MVNELKEKRKEQARNKGRNTTNGNDDEIVKLESVVKDDPDEIIWSANTGNKIIDNSVLHDNLSLTIYLGGKSYDVRSPDFRIVEDIDHIRSQQKDGGLPMSKLKELKNKQQEMVEDMIPDFNFDDRSIRISSTDINNLIILCWRYHRFLTEKSIATGTRSISELEE